MVKVSTRYSGRNARYTKEMYGLVQRVIQAARSSVHMSNRRKIYGRGSYRFKSRTGKRRSGKRSYKRKYSPRRGRKRFSRVHRKRGFSNKR